MKRRLFPVAALLFWSASLQAQTVDDGLMVPKKALFTGVTYGHDGWTDYWEGALKRTNQNIGTLTTQSVTWMANYGVTDRINVIALVPYVSTRASGGTLHSQKGLQDLTVAAKYRLFEADFGTGGRALRGSVVASYGVPLSDYVADLLPLSIGLHSRQATGRLTLSYFSHGRWFADATGAYAWRSNVTLDRPSYFTDDQLFLTDQVSMPDVVVYAARVGYLKGGLMIPVTYVRQDTLGGGDIRRQDMPFVSNNMDFSKLDVVAMYTLPHPAHLAIRLDATRVLTGRNVGQSTTLSAGLLYTIHFSHK
ncbi:MAG TPA: hypothetical protein VGQ33_04880 [Vicinamibacteria bacterium]|nr:hypothetical protein [Vicinamibacteria bacterium]